MGRSVNSRDNARQFKGTQQVDSALLLVEVPPPPETLPVEAHFWWEYYCGLMIEAKCLSRLYIGSLKNFCMVAFFIDLLEIQLNEEGFLYHDSEKGEVVVNSKWNQLQKAYDQHDRLAGSLGFTPYSAKVNAIDTTGQAGPGAAPEPPPVDLERPTIPMSGTA